MKDVHDNHIAADICSCLQSHLTCASTHGTQHVDSSPWTFKAVKMKQSQKDVHSPIFGCFNNRQILASRSNFWWSGSGTEEKGDLLYIYIYIYIYIWPGTYWRWNHHSLTLGKERHGQHMTADPACWLASYTTSAATTFHQLHNISCHYFSPATQHQLPLLFASYTSAATTFSYTTSAATTFCQLHNISCHYFLPATQHQLPLLLASYTTSAVTTFSQLHNISCHYF